jgi:hypothetical protein
LPAALGRIAYQNKATVYGLLLRPRPSPSLLPIPSTLEPISASQQFCTHGVKTSIIIHMPIASFRAGESHPTASVGFLASLDFFRHACSRVCSDGLFSKGSRQHSMVVDCISSPGSPV